MSIRAWQTIFLVLFTALICFVLWALWELSGMTGEIVRLR